MMLFCRTCRHFTDKQGRGETGTCRRFPPTIVRKHDTICGGINSKYPEVTPAMRACGEHKHNKRLIRVDHAAGNVDVE
jgi:hypothetical protein